MTSGTYDRPKQETFWGQLQQTFQTRSLAFSPATMRNISIVLLLVTAAFLRLYQISAESFWIDEVSMIKATTSGYEHVYEEIANGRPPLIVIVGYHWLNVMGVSEMTARLLSALAGIASVMLLYQTGKELFNHRVGLMAALIMTFAEFHIFQSQNFRYYGLYILVVMISFYYLQRYLQTGKRYALVPFVLASILTYYAHAHGLLVIFGQGVFVVLQFWRYRPRLIPWAISEVLILIGIAPGLYNLLGSFLGFNQGELSTFTPATWIELPTAFSIVRSLIRFILYVPSYMSLVPWLLAVAFGLAALAFYIRRTGRQQWFSNVRALPSVVRDSFNEDNRWLFFIVCWFVFPLALPFVLSYLVAPMYVDRYVLAASPAFYLILAYGLYRLRNVLPEVTVLGAMLIVMVPGLVNNYYNADVNEQWRDITGVVMANEQSNDVVVFASNDPNRIIQVDDSFNYYYAGDLPQCLFREDMKDDVANVTALEDCIAGYDRVWVTALRWNGDADFAGGLPPFFETLGYDVALHNDYTKSILYRFEPVNETAQSAD